MNRVQPVWGRRLPILSRRALFESCAAAGLAALVDLAEVPDSFAASAADSSTVVVGANFVIKSLDPARAFETTSSTILHATYDCLVTFDGEDLKTPKPALATAWRVSADGVTYVFTLRSNVRFASGNVLTAQDVKWSFERVLNLKAASYFLLAGVADVQAPDPQTVVMRMKTAQPSIIPILAGPNLSVLDSKLVAENGGDASPNAPDQDKAEAFLNSHSAGTGAFTLVSYVPNQQVVLERNPNHWRAASKVDRVILRDVTDPASEQLQLQRQDFDIAIGLGQDQVKVLRTTPGVTVKTSPAADSFFVLMNATPAIGGPFSNPKVQQAVRSALDYQGILAIAGSGVVRVAGIIPPVFAGALDPRAAPKTDRDRAKSLLQDAGLTDVRGKLSYASDWTIDGIQMSLLAQKIQGDLAAVGITVDLDGLPLSTALQPYRDGKNQLGLWHYAADYPEASDFLLFAPGQLVGKRAGWTTETNGDAAALAALATAVNSETDPRKRVGLYQQFDRKIADIGPYAPLFQPVIPTAFRSNVRGVTYSSVWGLDLHALSRS